MVSDDSQDPSTRRTLKATLKLRTVHCRCSIHRILVKSLPALDTSLVTVISSDVGIRQFSRTLSMCE
jgi:hypothetical protein